MTEKGVLAITDHNSMSGIVAHHKACKTHRVKPVYGMEITTAENNHLTLLAKNRVGLLNLFRLAGTDKSYDDLDKLRSGVVAMTGDLMGAVPLAILREDKTALNHHLSTLHSIYRRDLYLEVIDHGLREQAVVNACLDRINLPKVRTNDVHFLSPADVDIHAVLMCDKMKRRLDPKFMTYHTISQAYLNELPYDEVAEEIADKCQVNLDMGQVFLPQYDVPEGYNEFSYLKAVAYKGLERRYPNFPTEYKERLDYELEVIRKMGFPGYFLIVWDFIRFAHSNGVPVGPGRGSGAGSLVAWCLRITDLDPIHYNLLFERFLNPERVSMPDFDVDFGQEMRADVIRYVVEKYGEKSVCQIATFSELRSRSAWHSASRVLGIQTWEADRFSKSLPEPPKDEEVLNDVFEDGRVKAGTKKKYKKIEGILRENPKYRSVIKMACRLEGAYKSVGRGAAGVLIATGDLTDFIPVWDTQSKDFPIKVTDDDKNLTRYVSQLDKDDSETMGLVKFDFLGLKELDVIKYTLELIEQQGGIAPDMSKIPMDDKATFELISTGRTLGMFQVSSDGMSQLVRQMGADEFEDIVAAVALYRPGPMDAGMDEVYIRRKTGLEPVEYLHPDLEPILNTTYGIIVYQEQVMQIAQKICGYTLGGADLLRRAMGKKKPEEMEAQHEFFLSGGKKLGYEEELIVELWRQIETFARYGFNRSHAAAYAMITYHTAYLKAHYPAELLAAQMQVRHSDFRIVAQFIDDAKSFGVDVVEPTVMRSPKNFSVRDGKIWIGLAGLQSINARVALDIEANGPYDHLTDFFSKIRMDKKSFDSLLSAGAFDELLPDDIRQARADMTAQHKKFLSEFKKTNSGQENMFGVMEIPFHAGVVEPMDRREMLELEREYLGRYRTGHPADEFRKKALSLGIISISDLTDIEGDTQRICGVVTEISEITTKNNDLMAFMRVEDETGGVDMTIFNRDYVPAKHNAMVGEVVFALIEMSYYKGRPSPKMVEVEDGYK